MVDIYKDSGALHKHTTHLVAEQGGGIPSNYPYDYFPLKGDQGKPLTPEVGGEAYSAWMKRDDNGDFTNIAILNEHQVSEIYNSRPDVPADFDSKKGSWSSRPEVFLEKNTGLAISQLVAAKNGVFNPQMKIDALVTIEGAENISLEKGLQGKQNTLDAPLVDVTTATADYLAKMQAAAAAIPVATPKVTENFNDKSDNPVSNFVPNAKLDPLFSKLDDSISGGKEFKVNRDAKNILKYLYKESGDDFDADAKNIVEGLKGRGLSEHAAIVEAYAEDPSRASYKVARKAINNAVTPDTPESKIAYIPGGDSNSTVSFEEAYGKITAGMEKLAPMLEEAYAAVTAAQAAITPDVIDKALKAQGTDPDSLTKDQKTYLQERAQGAVSDAVQNAKGDIAEAINPSNIRGIVDGVMSNADELLKQRVIEECAASPMMQEKIDCTNLFMPK